MIIIFSGVADEELTASLREQRPTRTLGSMQPNAEAETRRSCNSNNAHAGILDDHDGAVAPGQSNRDMRSFLARCASCRDVHDVRPRRRPRKAEPDRAQIFEGLLAFTNGAS